MKTPIKKIMLDLGGKEIELTLALGQPSPVLVWNHDYPEQCGNVEAWLAQFRQRVCADER